MPFVGPYSLFVTKTHPYPSNFRENDFSFVPRLTQGGTTEKHGYHLLAQVGLSIEVIASYDYKQWRL